MQARNFEFKAKNMFVQITWKSNFLASLLFRKKFDFFRFWIFCSKIWIFQFQIELKSWIFEVWTNKKFEERFFVYFWIFEKIVASKHPICMENWKISSFLTFTENILFVESKSSWISLLSRYFGCFHTNCHVITSFQGRTTPLSRGGSY